MYNYEFQIHQHHFKLIIHEEVLYKLFEKISILLPQL